MMGNTLKDRSLVNILIVDDEADVREALRQVLSDELYCCETAPNGHDAMRRMAEKNFHVVVSDIRMPGMNGIELLQAAQQASPDTAFIMITGAIDVSIAVKALKLGAYDYIIKPFDVEELLISVDRALERRLLQIEKRLYQQNLERCVVERTVELRNALQALEETYKVTLEALVTALDAREHETNAHSFRVREYTLHLARTMGITDSKLLTDIGRGALLHDIGKIGVPDSILLKPAKLTPEEWVEMRKHPKIGYQILQDIKFLEPAAEIVFCHHERYDGSGYPNGLKGKDIPLGARIFAVIDCLDAMTSDRPYRKAQPYEAARQEIIRCSDKQFDPEVVEAFLKVPEEDWLSIRRSVNLLNLKRVELAHALDQAP